MAGAGIRDKDGAENKLISAPQHWGNYWVHKNSAVSIIMFAAVRRVCGRSGGLVAREGEVVWFFLQYTCQMELNIL